jgi:hypothetical protein
LDAEQIWRGSFCAFVVELWHRPGLASRTSLVLTQDVSSFPIAALHRFTDANPDSQIESELLSNTLRARSTFVERALVSASEARIVSPVGFHALSSFFAWTLGLLSLFSRYSIFASATGISNRAFRIGLLRGVKAVAHL